MNKITTLTSCLKCSSKQTLKGICREGVYFCLCVTCMEETPLQQFCPDCGGEAAAVKRSGPQYRLWCSVCIKSHTLFYDCADTSASFLSKI